MQVQHPLPCHQPSFEFHLVERLCQEIICPGGHSFQEVLSGVLAGQQHGVYVALVWVLAANVAADLDAVHPGQYPVQKGELGRVHSPKQTPRFTPIVSGHHLESPLGKMAANYSQVHRGIFSH